MRKSSNILTFLFSITLLVTFPSRAFEQLPRHFDCSTSAFCEQSLRNLAIKPVDSYALISMVRPFVVQPAEWLSPLLLELSDDKDPEVQQLALVFLQEMPGLSDSYWPTVSMKMDIDPQRWIDIALKMRDPEVVPSVLKLILNNKLDAELFRPKWSESQLQLRNFLEDELKRLSVTEHSVNCDPADNFSQSLCSKLNVLFLSLPIEHRLHLWQIWGRRLAENTLPEDFLRLLLGLVNRDFLRQLPPELAAHTDSQLIRLKVSNPKFAYAAQHTLIDLGRPSAAIEVTERLKEFLAMEARPKYLNPMFDVAELAPFVKPEAFSNFKKPMASDPDYSTWIILQGMTRQSGAETEIWRAWQKQNAPVDNAAALVAAAYYSASLWQQLQVQAKQHWYPPIITLADSLSKQIAVTRGINEEGRLVRRKMLNFRDLLHMPICNNLRETPASPDHNKWYNHEQLESVTYRFPDSEADGFTVANVVAPWLSTTTGTEFHHLVSQWGVDESLGRRGETSGSAENKVFNFEPRAALQFGRGWISVADHGEWSGELRYVDEQNSIQIATGNFLDVFLVGSNVLVLKGAAYSSDGRIYKLMQNDKGVWKLELWREIPATVDVAWQLADGRIVLQSRAGTFLLSPSGTLQMANCLTIAR